jgi:hypothetical protein
MGKRTFTYVVEVDVSDEIAYGSLAAPVKTAKALKCAVVRGCYDKWNTDGNLYDVNIDRLVKVKVVKAVKGT